MVSNGWDLKNLGRLATKIGSGVTPKGGSNAYKPSGIPLIRSQNVLWGNVDLSDVAYIDEDQHAKMKGSIVYKNDVLLNITGASIGRSAVSHLNEANVNQHVCIIRSDALEPEYLKNFLLSFYGQKQIEQFQAGGNRQGLNFEQIKSFKLPVPPLPEQRKIAQILSIWDRGIATTEKLIDASKQQKKALMQQLLTGKKRLVDPETGKAFEGDWEEVKLSKLFTRVTEKNKGQSTNVVTISAQHGLIRQEEFFKKSIASETLDNYFILRKGQFAYNKSYSNGYPMGAIKRLNRYDDAVVTSLYICFEIKNSAHTSSCFMEQYFESGLLNRGLTKVAAEGGRAHGLLNVKPTDFMGLALIVPKIKEQQKIASVLTAADKEIELLAAKLAHFKQEKKALMQQLLTGKRRVKVNEVA
ncbi:restriction endonuclease subunit S [Vibrio aestuarianus]|uniref:restriction endonuclease subunit S n=1 Tax=Vibrio aestuarianus TaxID=28171 RepID=UPI0015948AFF|nr:restriction endonuclease subunit S [Vibrio aestuarianus]MDE1234164.1 restriction endonuclease subunit S [Vibrio aestuarianus]MDE1245164.1 restriction endonuclease subunit S [Vibrio aestuarianus]NGZ63964.1 restriction endonuclease subunit S [Vibrio aestuarianus subsp. cardii]